MIKINSFTLKESGKCSNIIASLPHSSYRITKEMQNNINPQVIFANNDWYLNELYDFLNEINITTISNNYSRYVIDVNRKPDFKDNHDKYTNSMIYFKTTFNKLIYDKIPSNKEINDRIEKIYIPYHQCLSNKIEYLLSKNKKVYLFDLHSFFAQSDADIVLGTRYGTTCSKEFLDLVYNTLINEGFKVKVDEVGLRGGYITYHYSEIDNVEAIQIELRYTNYIENRYFDEEYKPKINYELFNTTKQRLKRAFEIIKKELSD